MLMEEADQIRSLKGGQMKDAVELTRDCCAIPSATAEERWAGIWDRCCSCLEHKNLHLFLLDRENKPVEEKKMCSQNLDLILTFIFLHNISRK